MQDAPLPIYESHRLVGLELEYDSGSAEFRSPQHIPNWEPKHDGSLRNGREFVLEPAVPYNGLIPHVKAFSDAFDPIKIGLTSRGGYHVHVQAHDYTHEQAYRLARIYTRFQEVVNKLLAKSRSNNHFCQPYNINALTLNGLIEEFELDAEADTRASAKCSRTYRTLNFAMLRCRNPQERSIEFRQGSPSKRFANIYGWATLVVALTDMAKDEQTYALSTQLNPDLDGFLTLLAHWEQRTHAENLVKWTQWRYDIMNQLPTQEMKVKLLTYLSTGSHGLFSIATHLNANYPTVLRLLEQAMSDGTVQCVARRYRLTVLPEDLAQTDLDQLRHAASTRETQTSELSEEPQPPTRVTTGINDTQFCLQP